MQAESNKNKKERLNLWVVSSFNASVTIGIQYR